MAVVVVLIGTLLAGFFVTIGYFIGIEDTHEVWCQSKQGMYLEGDCYIKGEKVELK